ncbi:hypothetical protein GRS66_006214 [Saccharomyces pastorianus]|uniref:Uncharacterized protein n=1 Tax=Saccharomyces pastorianus TaxID=27292 RepID=A0A6C1E4S1_SACPS|nr:hypothetical protein GRS66_006214 [Saccharomyces pastorianus]
MNAIAAYTNDTSYSYLYTSGIDSTSSYSINGIYSTESSNNENGETSSPETTTLAGQYSESERVSTNEGQSSTISQQLTSAAVTVRSSDFMSKSTIVATASSSSVPRPIQATSEAPSLSQIHSYDTKPVSRSLLSQSSSSSYTSDATAVPRGTNPIITTTFSSSKGEIIPTQTSAASRTASLAQVVPESSKLSRTTLTTTTHVSNGETTQTQFFSTITSMIPTEEYTIDEFSGDYITNDPGGELIVEYSSSQTATIILSSKGETISTKTSSTSNAASISQVVTGASQLSRITSTITTQSASITQTQPFSLISSIKLTQVSSTSEWETSENDGGIFTKYPNQELIVDDPSSLSLKTTVSSSMKSQSEHTESNSITKSSTLNQNSIVTSIPYAEASTLSTIPSVSSYTSSPAAVGPSASSYTSSSAAAAVGPSASSYTSSPAAVGSSASSYTSSPAAVGPSASSASPYTSSPAAVSPSASSYTSSPAAVSPSASSYTSSPTAVGPFSSTQTISPSFYTPFSPATTYASGLSSVQSLLTSVTVTPVISIHTTSSSSQQVSSTPYKTILQSISISSISSDATFSSPVSIISITSFASNRVETSPLGSSTQSSSTYVAESSKSNIPLTQLPSGSEASYRMTNQNTASNDQLTTTRQSNLPYSSSKKTLDNEFFSATFQTNPTGLTKSDTLSTSASGSSTPQLVASGVSDSSIDLGSHITSLYHSASSISSKKYSKETNIITKSFSNTQGSVTRSTTTYQSSRQSRISTAKTTVNTQNHVLTTTSSSTFSKSANSIAGSISLSNKLSKTTTDSRGTLSSTTRRNSHNSSLKTGESNFGISTKPSTNTIGTATQTQEITDSKSITAVPSTYPTRPYTTSNDYAWLPTAIIVEPSKSDASTTSFNPSITGSLPNVIAPAISVPEPANHTLITIGFTAGLNYVFLVKNPLSSAQVFSFLPLVLKYPFSDTTSQPEESGTYEMGSSSFALSYKSGSSTTTLSPKSVSPISVVEKRKKGEKSGVTSTANLDLPSIGNSSIVVKQIVPMIDSSKAYVIAVAEVYFPTEALSFLQELILDSNSTLYNNPQTPLRTLAGLIDSSIPLGGLTLYGSNNGCSICDSSPSVSDSSNKSSTGNAGTNEYGSLDDFANSLTDHMPWRITKRFIIYLTCLTAGVLMWLLLALLAFRHRNILLGRRPRNCIEKTPNNERGLEGIGVSTSRSSSENHNYNEKNTNNESESFHLMEDDRYIATGENTIYSATHGLHYTVDEDGDLFYRKSMPDDFDEINENEDSGIDSILRECVYDKHQDTTEAYLNDEESISSNLDVDENGNIRLYDTYSDEDEPNCSHLQDEVIEDYNNSHVYKMQLQGLEIGSYTTGDDPNTGNLITNEFSSGSQTCLPSTAYTTPLDTDSIKLHILGHAGSSLQKPVQAFISNHEELEIEDIDDNGSVSDIQVEELDALDEELYKRMSKIVKQQNN